MTGLVDDIGGLFVTQIQALVSTRLAEGWLLTAATDHFLFWTHIT